MVTAATPPPAPRNEAAVAGGARRFGGLDTLVNCVGIFDFYRGLGELDADLIDAAFDEMFAVNVKSHLQRQGGAARAARSGARLGYPDRIHVGYYPGRGGVLYVPPSSPCAASSPRSPTSWRRRSGSTASRPAARSTPTCAACRASAWTSARLDDTPGREAELAARVPLQGRAQRRGPRLELRLPRLGPRPRHHRQTSCTQTAGSRSSDDPPSPKRKELTCPYSRPT